MRIGRHSVLDPLIIAPVKVADIGGNRGGAGAEFTAEGIGIGFKEDPSVLCGDGKFVKLSCFHFRNKELVDPGVCQRRHQSCLRIPVVKISYKADRFCVRSPDSKVEALFSFVGLWMCSQLFKNVIVGAFAKQITIQLGDKSGADLFSGSDFI